MSERPNESLAALLERRLTRRRVLAASGPALAGSLALPAAALWAPQAHSDALGFEPLAPSGDDRVRVAAGHRAQVVVRWGDPLLAGAPALDTRTLGDGSLLEPAGAAAQAAQFGYNCDGMGLFTLGGRRVACVNHEFPSHELMFPGMAAALAERRAGEFVSAHPGCVAYMQAAVGVSVLELAADGVGVALGSPFNRRITATTPMHLAGPAAGHELLASEADADGVGVLGTLANCAAGVTPWGTYLTAEENIDTFFGNARRASFTPALAAAHRRLRMHGRDSRYRWEYADARFDVARHPNEPLKFGWVVEIDPSSERSIPKKRTALGRFKHEAATMVLAADGRAVVYMGDDEAFEYFYKFVSAAAVDAARPERNSDLLDAGTLYVARLADDGSGEWRPLVWGEGPLTPAMGFGSQADVLLRCREAADLLGATPLDRPEDVAVSPLTGKVYLSCTQNVARRGGVVEAGGRNVSAAATAASPRSPNPSGHILELSEDGDDAAALRFGWEILLLAGDAEHGRRLARLAFDGTALPPEASYYGEAGGAVESFAGPDNLAVDRRGNLWIVTDAAQPEGRNNGCFVCSTRGPARGQARQFMSGPRGAEVCGCEFAPGCETLYLTVQHPGEGGSLEAPLSHWPDGGQSAPRPSLVAISREGGGEVGS